MSGLAAVQPGNTERRRFAYEAQSGDGQTFRGALQGTSLEDVQARLGALHLRVLSVAQEEAPAAPRRRALGSDDFLMFNEQLGHLAKAGLPVERGLRLIAGDMKRGRLARAAQEVAGELERGVPLDQAFSRHASRFPPLYGKLIDAGVKSGNLPGMLFNLGRHVELVARLRESLWRTISYPLAVLAGMALVMLFLSVYVLPRFAVLFEQFRMRPPVVTEALLAFAAIYPIVLVVAAGIVLVVILANLLLSRTALMAAARDTFMRHMPLIGPVLRASLLARWLDALRLGVEAGLDLPRAIELATEATRASGRLAREAGELNQLIASGRPLESFRGDMIPPSVPAAIELASRAGDLPTTLYTLARMYAEQAEHRLRLLPSIITPALMIVIGGELALCVAASFLPLLHFIRSVSGGEEGGL